MKLINEKALISILEFNAHYMKISLKHNPVVWNNVDQWMSASSVLKIQQKEFEGTLSKAVGGIGIIHLYYIISEEDALSLSKYSNSGEVLFSIIDINPVKKSYSSEIKSFILEMKKAAGKEGWTTRALFSMILSHMGEKTVVLNSKIDINIVNRVKGYYDEFFKDTGILIGEKNITVEEKAKNSIDSKKCIVCGADVEFVKKGVLYVLCERHKTEFLSIGRRLFEERYL